jgi:hypothetical protein
MGAESPIGEDNSVAWIQLDDFRPRGVARSNNESITVFCGLRGDTRERLAHGESLLFSPRDGQAESSAGVEQFGNVTFQPDDIP